MGDDLDIKNISILKKHLKDIITNLESLESVAQGTREVDNDKCTNLKLQTERILQKLEQTQLENFVKLANKRRRRREKHKKLKQAATKQTATATPKLPIVQKPKTITEPKKVEIKTEQPNILKLHNRLRRFKDAQEHLRTFELLKKLHLARTQDEQGTEQFASQFEQLNAVWSKVLQEHAPETTPAHRLERQWREVIFGPNETAHRAQRVRLKDFLRIRKTWDSYLVHDEEAVGSSIPNGWVLPTPAASADWAVFLQK